MSEKPSVVVLRKVPDDVTARLTRDYDAKLNVEDKPLSADEIVERAQGCDALICTPTDKITEEVINRLPDSIKIIATFSVGYEHVNVAAAKARGITVTNTPDVLTDATAEIALLCMLGAARRAQEAGDMIRQDKWPGWCPTQLVGVSLSGKRLGIFGMGRIGQAVADRARGFGMEIHYNNRSRLSEDKEKGAIFHESAEDLLKVSDFLSINCPATPETIGFLNAERIELLPENAVVVNTARGTVVDDESLIAALKSGRVFAAGLDVFDGEPNINPKYRDLDNAFILPHIGSATIETRNAMGFKCLNNLDAFFADRPVPDPVS